MLSRQIDEWGEGLEIRVRVHASRVLDPCHVTFACKQKPCMTGRSQGSGTMTACHIRWAPPSVNTAVIRNLSIYPSSCSPYSLVVPPSAPTTYTDTHTTSFAVGGDGCPCSFSPGGWCGGGCKVMMSLSSGGFQMYCSPLPMNTASC